MSTPSSEQVPSALFTAREQTEQPRGLWDVLTDDLEPGSLVDAAAAVEPEMPAPESPPTVDAAVEERITGAQAQGFEAGLAQGREEGQREAEAQLRESLAAEYATQDRERSERLQLAVAQLAQAQHNLAERFVAEAVDLALVLAEELAGAAMAQDPGRLVQVISAALAERQCETRATLFLHPDDLEGVRERAPEIRAGADAKGAPLPDELRFVADPALAPGAYRLEDDAGGIDGGLDGVLSELRGELRRALSAPAREDSGPQETPLEAAS